MSIFDHRLKPETVGVSGSLSSPFELLVQPNPFYGKCQIIFSFTHPGNVKLEVIDIHGQSQLLISYGYLYKGKHNLNLDISYLPKGMYYLKVSKGDLSEVKKIINN